jgi:hypothetical protein
MVTGRDRLGEAMSFAGQELVEGRDACFVAFLQYSCPKRRILSKPNAVVIETVRLQPGSNLGC